jgi:hypothetical protein
MGKFLLATSLAALAIASPVFADKGGGGHGGGNGGDQGGGDRGDRGGRSGGDGGQSFRVDHGRGNSGGDGGQSVRAEQARGHGDELRVERQVERGYRETQARGENRNEQFRYAQGGRDNGSRTNGQQRREISRYVQRNDNRQFDTRRGEGGQFVSRDFNDGNDRYRSGGNGCPPGLANKENGCLPPGQAARFLGARLQDNYANSQLPFQYRSWYRDDGDHFYRSGDGYIYRVNRSNNLVDGLIPLFSGGDYYAVGDRWPANYNFYNVPYQYRDYYADTGQYNYRYGDGAIYRVNNGSGLIDGIVALLAGDLGVGQQLPTGYDVYNVPFQYRDRYYDTADNMYRYNDGYIYQVDPKTRLISAVIDAII